MNSFCKASVLFLTYNQENYIEQAVRSALVQETGFEYEIVIGEDCSTDRTRDILQELAAEHPCKMRLLLRERNLGGAINYRETYAACRGEYVALLEGDDYWTDPHKLQRQVEALDAHPEWSACFHPVPYVDASGTFLKRVHPPRAFTEVSHHMLLEENLIQSCSVVLRKQRLPAIPAWFAEMKLGDWPTFLLLSETGPIGCLPEHMACYRLHPASYWSTKAHPERVRHVFQMFMILGRETSPSRAKDYYQAGEEFVEKQLLVYQAELDRVHASLGAAWSDLAAAGVERDAVRAERDAFQAERDAVQAERDAVRAERNAVRAERDAMRVELTAIKQSYSWRLIRLLCRPLDILLRLFHHDRGAASTAQPVRSIQERKIVP